MELIGKKVMLRDFQKSDLADHVKWHTEDLEWEKWDAPWRKNDRTDPIEYAERRLASLRTKKDDEIRWTFEICTYPEGKHVGWMNCYCLNLFYNYSSRQTSRYALGIDIVPVEERGKGLGKECFQLFTKYLLEFGITRVFTQTWAGNVKMENLAKSLGFRPVNLKKDKYVCDGRKYSVITYCLELE